MGRRRSPATDLPSTPPSRPWPVRRRFPITYHDVDALNHVNHAVYFQHMETLRCDYYLPLLGLTDPRQLDIILVEAACRYLAPAFYGEELLGEAVPARPLGRTSIPILYRFTAPDRPEHVYARGRTVAVTYDYARHAKKEIAPTLRSRLEADAIDPTADEWELRPTTTRST